MTDRTIPRDTLARMVRSIDPDWHLAERRLADAGFAAVYHVVVETPTGPRECVLKATPDGDRHGIDVEARLLTVLGDHTSLPVPAVFGVVDEHDDLPTPFFCAESMPGDAVPFEEVAAFSDAALRRLARLTGAFLAELHSLEAVDAFGRVDRVRSERLRGGRPSSDPGRLAVAEARDSWPALLDEWIDRELEALKATRFADLIPRLRPSLAAERERLAGPFEPVLGRIDHGLHNVLCDPKTGEPTAVIDWAFTLAVPPGYDLECVEFVLSGDVLSTLPEVSSRRALVRNAMLEGYHALSGSVPDDLRENRPCYELLTHARAMNHLDAGAAPIPANRVDEAAAGLRARVNERLEASGR